MTTTQLQQITTTQLQQITPHDARRLFPRLTEIPPNETPFLVFHSPRWVDLCTWNGTRLLYRTSKPATASATQPLSQTEKP